MQIDPAVLDFLHACGVRNLAADRLDLLTRFLSDLRDANAHLNLTRITADAEFWTKHVADSLAVGLAFPELLSTGLRAADVGCGAGFPAIPLAWANPALRITGIEAVQKKAAFLQAEREALGLANLAVLALQAREAGRLPEYAGTCDAVLLRAVGGPATLVRDCRQLLRPGAGARLVFYMTPATVAEARPVAAREAHKYGLEVVESACLDLPCGAGTRQFLMLVRP